MSEVVFADPSNKEARELAADALEQLGYQAEAGTWRNEYLTGAMELRNGVPKTSGVNTLSADVLKGITVDLLLDFIAVRLNADKADGKRLALNWTFTDVGEKLSGKLSPNADASFTLSRMTLIRCFSNRRPFRTQSRRGK